MFTIILASSTSENTVFTLTVHIVSIIHGCIIRGNTISSSPSSTWSILQSIYQLAVGITDSHILMRWYVLENVHTPDVVYKTICFFDQHIVRGVMVWLANICVCSHPLSVFILNDIITSYTQNKQNTHPIHHSQVHAHFKCFGHIGEQLVVRQLHPVDVLTLEEEIYIHEDDMYCSCCIRNGMNQPLCRWLFFLVHPHMYEWLQA